MQSAAHSIMLILGARELEACPNCGEVESYNIVCTFHRTDKIYTDGHVEEGHQQFAWADRRCNNCDYCVEL